MIAEFVTAFDAKREWLSQQFAAGHPGSYKDIVRLVVEAVGDDSYARPDPERIHQVDDGDYQGTLVFVIGARGYQPSDYWYVKVGYGSCSGCDTLESICGYSSDKPNEEQVKDYMTLALHIVQGLGRMGGDEA